MKNLNTGIYQIVNQVNGKRYIGSALSLKTRERNHFSSLLYNKHHSIHLQRSYNKYDKENFEFQILLYCSKEDLIFYEQRAIDAYDFKKELYNMNPMAGSPLGTIQSLETRQKNSNSKKGKKRNPEHVKKIANSQRGQKRPKVSKEKNGSYVKTNDTLIIQLHSEGKTTKEISILTGYTKRIISNRLKWNNLETNRDNKKKDVDIEYIHELRLKGLYYYEIAKIMNVSETVISKNYRKSKYYKGKIYGKK